MASHSLPPPSDFGDSDLMNYAVRMVIPMRREFGCQLDVSTFLQDFGYARQILAQARSSSDGRLREYAHYLESKMFGPRNGPHRASAAAAAAAVGSPPPSVAPAPPAPADAPVSEAEMRARMMAKYKGGLR